MAEPQTPAQGERERLTVGERWERGIPHDPRSVAIAKSIAAIDDEQNSGAFDWKFGGDGDNGEDLLYALDVHFARLDAAAPAEGDVQNLRSALIAEGHTADCPVVHGASVDCVPRGGCDARTTRESYPHLFEHESLAAPADERAEGEREIELADALRELADRFDECHREGRVPEQVHESEALSRARRALNRARRNREDER